MATLPSITSFSRASLLCGTLVSAGQAAEKRGFEEHSGLRAAGKAMLFHKDEIGASGGDLAEAADWRFETRTGRSSAQWSTWWMIRSRGRATGHSVDAGSGAGTSALLSEARDAGASSSCSAIMGTCSITVPS